MTLQHAEGRADVPNPHVLTFSCLLLCILHVSLLRVPAGFGRIGRNFLRCLEGRTDSLLEVIAINDSGGVKQVGTCGWTCACHGTVCWFVLVVGCWLLSGRGV
jgi:hypothetical protein